MKYIKLFEAKRNFTLIFDIITKLAKVYGLMPFRSNNVMGIMEYEPLNKKWTQEVIHISITQSKFDLHIVYRNIEFGITGQKIILGEDTKEFIEKLNNILKENVDEYEYLMYIIKKENIQKYIKALEENVDMLIEEFKMKKEAGKYNL